MILIQVFQQMKTEDYLDMFGTSYETIITPNCTIAIFPNEYDDFRYFSYVNGIHVRNGGTHIDVLVDEMIVPKIREKLIKKHKNIKPGDIKNKLHFVSLMTGLSSKFGGQTKEMLEVSRPDLRTYFVNIDFDKFINKLIKNKDIVEPITEIFELKEQQRLKKELNEKDKPVKKIKNEKFTAPSHKWHRLFIGEGFSAISGLMPVLGRVENGFFELKGLPLNVVGTSLQKIIANVELAGLKDVLGMKWTENNESITFDEVVFATDQDLDGFRIRGLLYAFFYRFAPELLKTGKIKVLCTPLMLLKKGDKVIKVYFDFDEFDASDIKRGYDVKYLKGIGSWTPAEFAQVIDMYGLDGLIQTYEWDDEAPQLLKEWLDDNYVLERRQYLQENDFNVNDI